jgi:hypothetical protein
MIEVEIQVSKLTKTAKNLLEIIKALDGKKAQKVRKKSYFKSLKLAIFQSKKLKMDHCEFGEITNQFQS